MTTEQAAVAKSVVGLPATHPDPDRFAAPMVILSGPAAHPGRGGAT